MQESLKKALGALLLDVNVVAFAQDPKNTTLREQLEKVLGPMPASVKTSLGITRADDEAFYAARPSLRDRQGTWDQDNGDATTLALRDPAEEGTDDMTTTEETGGKKKEKEFKNVDIVRGGNEITVPDGMSLRQARTWLERKEVEEEQEIAIDEVVDAFVLEGAYAFMKAIARTYGFAALVPTPGFFGPNPPTMIGVDIGVNETAQVPWGRIEVPKIAGFLETGLMVKDNRVLFRIGGEVKQKHKHEVKRLADLTRQIVKDESIYRGKAIRVAFPDTTDPRKINPRDCPKFIATDSTRVDELIFSQKVRTSVNTSLFTPIEHTDNCRKYQIPLKRGILLEGPFGTGKTLTAYVAAKKCEENGWTFIYLSTVKDLKTAIHFAKQYQPAVIFAEDVDRAMDGERDEKMDEILNTVDGVDTKGMELIIVLTTNNVERIEPAMMRPGRLDAIISVEAPDAEASIKLVKLYARGRLDEQDNYDVVGQKLNGQIPAVIREVVERSKLAAVGRLQGTEQLVLKAADLEFAADEMLNHLRLMAQKPVDERSDIEKAADKIAVGLTDAFLSPAKSNGRHDTNERKATAQA